MARRRNVPTRAKFIRHLDDGVEVEVMSKGVPYSVLLDLDVWMTIFVNQAQLSISRSRGGKPFIRVSKRDHSSVLARFVTDSQPGTQAHHVHSQNTLDNRRSNLIVLTPKQHRRIHTDQRREAKLCA